MYSSIVKVGIELGQLNGAFGNRTACTLLFRFSKVITTDQHLPYNTIKTFN